MAAAPAILDYMSVDFFDTTGKRVRILREDKGLSQVQLAAEMERFGVSINNSFISRIEKSSANPSMEVLVALAKALGTTTDYLLLLSDNPFPDEQEASLSYQIDSEDFRRVIDELVDLVLSMPVDEARFVLDIVRRIKRGSGGAPPRIIGSE